MSTTLVSTGQITIVDNNDARPITAYITANPGTQQVFTKDESFIAYTPDWTTANSNAGLILTARVFVGATNSAQEVTGQLSNRRWTTNLTTAITGTNALISADAQLSAVFRQGAGLTYTTVHNSSGSTITIKSNFLETVSQSVIYFEGDYTDPATGLVSRVVAQIQLGMVRTGTNAVFVLTRGTSSIEQATGSTKNVAVIAADLVRAAGIDTTGINYRFFEAFGATQITTALAGASTKYGLKTIAPGVSPTGSTSEIGVNLPAAGAWSTHNALVIHESAVADMGVYRVEARDADNVVYQAFFTIYDVSDPYEVRVLSSSGDKLQNGVGSTSLTPDVYYGAVKVSSLTGWAFNWIFFNRNGVRSAFVNPTRTALSGGRTISANTAGTSAVITYSGTAITFAAGDLIKAVTASGVDKIYEVASATGNTVTIRTPVTNSSWLNFTAYPAPTSSEFVDGRLFVCENNQGRLTSSGGASITVTGDDIDVKGTIFCEALRP